MHAATFLRSLTRLCTRIGVSVALFRSRVPALYSGEDQGGCVEGSLLSSKTHAEDWDAEGPIQTVRTGQSVVAAVVSGLGPCKVVVPVRCSRKSTSCAFCDTAAGFSCVHALRCRSISRGGGTEDSSSKKKPVPDEDAARSTLPISMFNCPYTVRVDAEVCKLMEAGNSLAVRAPSNCPTCSKKRDDTSLKTDTGEVMCSKGFCRMKVESFFCDSPACARRIYPDGRSVGIVILSTSTASTVAVMRDMAREVPTSGSTFGACYRRWFNAFMDLCDSDLYPKMKTVSTRSRQTVSSVFFLALRLMCKEPPLWAFKCTTCQDKSGRFRVITADGIWAGYLNRLASERDVVPTEVCASLKSKVDAASLHPSEWVRRYVCMALKQPSKPVVIKTGQLNSALRALAFLCPATLPGAKETASECQSTGLLRLRTLLMSFWQLSHSSLSLCDGILVFIRKLLGPRCF